MTYHGTEKYVEKNTTTRNGTTEEFLFCIPTLENGILQNTCNFLFPGMQLHLLGSKKASICWRSCAQDHSSNLFQEPCFRNSFHWVYLSLSTSLMVELKDAPGEISRNNIKVSVGVQRLWSELVNCQLFQLESSTALILKQFGLQ